MFLFLPFFVSSWFGFGSLRVCGITCSVNQDLDYFQKHWKRKYDRVLSLPVFKQNHMQSMVLMTETMMVMMEMAMVMTMMIMTRLSLQLQLILFSDSSSCRSTEERIRTLTCCGPAVSRTGCSPTQLSPVRTGWITALGPRPSTKGS